MKKLSFTAVFLLVCSGVYATGTPVFDLMNNIHNVESAHQQVLQYQAQLQNMKNATSFSWDDASNTITNLISEVDTLKYYKDEAGSVGAYLNSQSSMQDYRNQECLSCGDTQAFYNREAKTFEAQKRANDARVRGIDHQQASLEADAKKLKTLQTQAQNAEGQMQAIQSANQLASAEANQLLQIRGLMLAGQQAEAAEQAARANREAIQAAGDEKFKSGTLHKSAYKGW